jgi:hypothetical protein
LLLRNRFYFFPRKWHLGIRLRKYGFYTGLYIKLAFHNRVIIRWNWRANTMLDKYQCQRNQIVRNWNRHQFVKYNSPACRLFIPPLPRLGFGCLNEEKA